MMLYIFIFLSVFITHNYAIGVSSKLDFGEPGFVSSTPFKEKIFVTNKVIKVKKDSGSFDNLGVVCTAEGCNKTSTNNDSIKSDVIVEVRTRVNIKRNETKSEVEDTSDVPIVIGYNGIGVDPTQIQGDENPIYLPTYSFSDVSPMTVDRNFGSNVLNNQPIGYNFKTASPRYVSSQDNKNYKYYLNGVEVKIPYFEPSYHRHYYGENPPQQSTWHTGKNSNFNPVEFNIPKPVWMPSTWTKQFNLNQKNNHGANCVCTKHSPGLQWYPRHRSINTDNSRRTSVINDPGTQINDKLAPLV